MSERAILDALGAIARRELDWEGSLTSDTSLVEALALDSIRLLQLLVAVEDHFELCLDEDDEQGLVSAGDLVTLIQERGGG